jgi:hypothetical protein
MANEKVTNERVSQLIELVATEVAPGDLFFIADISTHESKKFSATSLLTFINASASINAAHANIADTASWANNLTSIPPTASFANSALSASYAIQSNNSVTASFALSAIAIIQTSSSYASASLSSSYSATSSFVKNSLTASFLQFIGGTINGSASFAISSSFAGTSRQSSNLIYNGQANGTASYAISASSAISADVALAAVSSVNADTASFFNGPRFGPTFITPVIVYSGTLAIPFGTPFDVSPYVPTGTQVVILDGSVDNNNANTVVGFIYIRADVSSPSLILTSYRTNNGTADAAGGQGCFPITAGLTFQFSATQPATGAGGIVIRLIGYY